MIYDKLAVKHNIRSSISKKWLWLLHGNCHCLWVFPRPIKMLSDTHSQKSRLIDTDIKKSNFLETSQAFWKASVNIVYIDGKQKSVEAFLLPKIRSSIQCRGAAKHTPQQRNRREKNKMWLFLFVTENRNYFPTLFSSFWGVLKHSFRINLGCI